MISPTVTLPTHHRKLTRKQACKYIGYARRAAKQIEKFAYGDSPFPATLEELEKRVGKLEDLHISATATVMRFRSKRAILDITAANSQVNNGDPQHMDKDRLQLQSTKSDGYGFIRILPLGFIPEFAAHLQKLRRGTSHE